MDLPALYLQRHRDRRVRAGHPWVFSNEVDMDKAPLSTFRPGDAAAIRTASGQWIGSGYVNPHSLIAARIVSRVAEEQLGPALLRKRLQQALALRERLFDEPFYRLAFGESDDLPGLVVDRYSDLLAVQLLTAGMERQRNEVLAALETLLKPQTVVLRNDVASRTLEGLASAIEVPLGAAPTLVEVCEHGAVFEVSPLQGQKTGWYFDQRPNRARLAAYARGARVLDVFSYGGAWGVQAAMAGAHEVLCVDSSRAVLDQAKRNAARNQIDDALAVHCGDAFETLKQLRAAGERFDIVVLDPPAFIRRKKDLDAGVEAYRRLNRLALGLLPRDAFLVTSSCSSHLRRDKFLEVLMQAARSQHRALQILEEGHQGPDHPVHPALSESAYLKVFFLRVL